MSNIDEIKEKLNSPELLEELLKVISQVVSPDSNQYFEISVHVDLITVPKIKVNISLNRDSKGKLKKGKISEEALTEKDWEVIAAYDFSKNSRAVLELFRKNNNEPLKGATEISEDVLICWQRESINLVFNEHGGLYSLKGMVHGGSQYEKPFKLYKMIR